MAKLHIDEQIHTYLLCIYANDYESNMDRTSGRYVECNVTQLFHPLGTKVENYPEAI